MDHHLPLTFSPEVSKALESQKPVLGLESTIITHGMPFPTNLQTAQEVEKTVREQGVVPATIGVIKGKIHIGLSKDQLKELSSSQEAPFKISRKDLGFALGMKKTGGTTVAATTFLCGLAGIKVFATGGIGGVHRGVQETWDISADLKAISESPVTIVCAGAKSILDVPKTLEALETLNVPVIGYKTKTFPLFYLSSGGPNLDLHLEDMDSLIECLKIHRSLFPKGGVVIANPIPQKDELSKELHTKALEEGLMKAKQNNIQGKELTPFLLDIMNELTKGQSLQSNIALILHNARLGASILTHL
jgi:pseudouridine-5'-phosphate glycosidase